MAIDLASSSSPFEFQNMLPLEVLAAVASKEYKNEIHTPNTQRVKTSCYVKRNIKKSTTSVLTFQEIKNMPLKFLIEKFSEMKSDELTKKYSYKCMLLPHACSSTFKSFGNEKKAYDEIKSHLRVHVQQLTVDYESNKGISELIFIPKSPNASSRNHEKLSKKFLKKQQVSLNNTTPRASPSKVKKKAKNTAYSLKTLKKSMVKSKYIPELNNDSQERNSTFMTDYPFIKQHYDDFFPNSNDEKCFLSKKVKKEIEKVFDSENEDDHYSSYNQHLKIAFFTDVELKEESYESLLDSDEISFSNDSSSSQENISRSSETSNTSFDNSIAFLQDHNYACFETSKNEKHLSTEVKCAPRKYEDPFMYVTSKLPPYVIKTPPFPHIHTPLLPEVAEIIEIKMQDSANQYSHCIDYLHDIDVPKSDIEESLTDEYNSDNEEKYSDDFFHRMNNSSGSVLECVENIENKKHSGSCVPKNEIPVNEDSENMENLEKDEKEIALTLIAKLHLKGKKKIPDSLMCQICPDKYFTAQATLIHHYRSHAGIKPYVCKLCSSKFTRQHSLNYHMLIHQNLSRFTCDFCGRTFRHPSHYKEHLRRHTGETPYHCTDCSLQFKTRNTFKRHLKTRHGKLLTAGGIEDLNAE